MKNRKKKWRSQEDLEDKKFWNEYNIRNKQARQSIQAEKASAMADIKNQIGALSVNIAESILKQKLDNDGAQNTLVENILNKSNLN